MDTNLPIIHIFNVDSIYDKITHKSRADSHSEKLLFPEIVWTLNKGIWYDMIWYKRNIDNNHHTPNTISRSTASHKDLLTDCCRHIVYDCNAISEYLCYYSNDTIIFAYQTSISPIHLSLIDNPIYNQINWNYIFFSQVNQ